MSHMMKKLRTRTTTRYTIASHPRKWRKPVPCPVCGGKDIRLRPLWQGSDRITTQVLQCRYMGCLECRCHVIVLANHTDLKEAIRVWNYLATDYQKAKENAK